jgi:hypothetical protein
VLADRPSSKKSPKFRARGASLLTVGAVQAGQWERVLPFLRSGKVEEFIKANEAKLSRK